MWLQWVGLAIGGFFAYCMGGSVTVITTAYILNRVSNLNWFNHSAKWTWVFVGWPIAIPVSILWFLLEGILSLTEKVGERVINKATEQRKKIGSYRKNP